MEEEMMHEAGNPASRRLSGYSDGYWDVMVDNMETQRDRRKLERIADEQGFNEDRKNYSH